MMAETLAERITRPETEIAQAEAQRALVAQGRAVVDAWRDGRARFVHVFAPRRIEQNVGISKLAEVNAALKSAIFSLFIKAPGTSDDVAAMLAKMRGYYEQQN